MQKTNFFKEFVKYASLNVLGMLGLSCYILADTFFVAQGLGTSGLAALNLAIPVYSFIHGSGLMLGMGGATKYSIYKGKNLDSAADNVFSNTVYAAVTISVIFALCGVLLSGALTSVLGADAEVFEMTDTYIKTILLFSPAFMLNNVFICFVRNDGNPKLSMIAMIAGSLSNVVLDYVFIFPCRMGMFGAAFATGLAPVISIMILSIHKLKRQNQFKLKIVKPSLKEIFSSMSLGFPSLVTEVSSGIVMIVFNSIILRLAGNTGVAAYGVIANLSLVVVAVYTGIAQGIQPLMSRSYGNGAISGVKRILGYALVSAAVFSVVIYAAVFFGSDQITAVFNSENNLQLQNIANTGMKLYFTAILFVGFNIIVSVFFTSTERAFPAHAISLLRGLLIIVPAAYLLSGLLGLTGVWLAFPTTEFIVAVVGAALYKHTQKRLS